MPGFVAEYCSRLQSISSRPDLESLYQWFYDRQSEIKATVEQLNERLNLRPPYDFKPDLPVLSAGPCDDMLILAANPGWNKEANLKEQKHCARSPHDYIKLVLDTRRTHHRGKDKWLNSQWWARAENFAAPLFPEHKDKWPGVWELIPFHSESWKGGILFADCDLHDMARESAYAALRMKPRILLVASKEGTVLIRSLLSNYIWKSERIGAGKVSDLIYGTLYEHQTEVIALGFQLVRSRFSDEKVHKAIEALRRNLR